MDTFHDKVNSVGTLHTRKAKTIDTDAKIVSRTSLQDKNYVSTKVHSTTSIV